MKPSGLLPILALVACGPSAAGRPPRAAPTDADACPRSCALLEACGGAPSGCEDECRRQQEPLREGFSASFTACLERQLEPPRCGTGENASIKKETARAENVRLCWFATIEAYAARDRGASMRTVIAAVCKRRARCDGAEVYPEKTCRADLESRTKDPAAKVLAAARETTVTSLAGCVEARPCGDDDPFQACFDAQKLGAPKLPAESPPQ